MAAQIRPNRLEVNDRFPMLGFTIRTDGTPQRAEVAIATDLALFRPEHKGQRTAANFYSSRAGGALSVPRGEAIYVVPPEVLARFIGAERLYVALATTPERNGTTPHVDVLPGEGSPYISLKGLTGRSLKRVRLLPSRQQRASGYGVSGTSSLEWAGDNAVPGLQPAAKVAPVSPAAPAAPAPVTGGDEDYDDGFGPLPPPEKSGTSNPADNPQSVGVAQSPRAQSRAFSDQSADAEDTAHGIEGPIPDAPSAASQSFAYSRPLDQQPEYPQASRFTPAASGNFRSVATPRAINRVVIHITDGGPNINGTISWFQNPSARVSAHYVVGQDGEVVQMVRHNDVAWHAGSANGDSIGIEHVANTHGLNPTEAEYCASAALVKWLCDTYGIPIDRDHILGHAEADPRTSHTACPNAVWDWDYFMDMVRNAACTPRAESQAQGFGWARGLEEEFFAEDATHGIEEPIPDTPNGASQSFAYSRPLDQQPEYPKADRFAPAHPSNYRVVRAARKIERIVIHINDAGSRIENTVRWFQNSNQRNSRNQPIHVSAHYVVGREGEVVQMVRHNDVAWHAGSANGDSIGIEHIANSRGLNPTEAEYSASAALVRWLCDTYGIPIDRYHILGHSEADPNTNHKACPNAVWDWDYFMDLVRNVASASSANSQAQALAMPAKVWARAQEVVAPFYDPADPASALTCQNDVFSQAREEWFVGVPNTRIFPHSAICQLNMVDAAGNGYGGTGFYIGPNRILTCAHNLHGMTSVTIIPGKNSSDEPFGRCTLNAPSWRVSNRYPTDGSDYDLAVIDSVPIAAPGGRWFGFLNQTPSDRLPIVVCGYSAQSDAVPELTQAIDADMQHLHGGYVAQQSNLEVMEYPILTLHGASGSPVYHIRGSGTELRALVCGVHVSGEPAAHGLNRACFITPNKINWIEGRTSALSLGTQSRLPQPPAPLLCRASALESEAVVPPPFPGAVIERIVGSQGNVRWQLEQLRGVKRPQGLEPGSGTLLAAPTVRLDDWPIIQGSDGAESLPLTVDFEYDGAAVGNVRIVPGLARSAQGVSLNVTANIKVPPDLLQRPSAVAALQVMIEYGFTWNDGAVEMAIIELTLFGDGRYERQNRTGPATQAKAA